MHVESNLQKYAAFVRIADTGSFTRAAQEMSVTQSGISRMVSDLEREWGFRVFDRDRNGVALTAEGAKVLPFARSMIRDYGALCGAVDGINRVEGGHITVGTFSSVATHWLPRMISEYRKDHPEVSFELLLGDYTELDEWISDGRVDFAFTRMPVKEGFDAEFIERDELMAILPEDDPLSKCASVSAEQLCGRPFIMLERGGQAEARRFFDDFGRSPDVHYSTWDDYAVMSMVESGLGISILPSLILRRIPYRVKAVPLDPPAYRDICVASRKGRTMSIVARSFLEYLRFR